MIKFKDYLHEARVSVEPKDLVQVHGRDLPALLGKGAFNSMIKHPFFNEWHMYEHGWKHGVESTGFHTVELYPYMKNVHTQPNGKIKPDFMVKFTISHFGSSGKVVQAVKYMRNNEDGPNEWKPLKNWK